MEKCKLTLASQKSLSVWVAVWVAVWVCWCVSLSVGLYLFMVSVFLSVFLSKREPLYKVGKCSETCMLTWKLLDGLIRLKFQGSYLIRRNFCANLNLREIARKLVLNFFTFAHKKIIIYYYLWEMLFSIEFFEKDNSSIHHG